MLLLPNGSPDVYYDTVNGVSVKKTKVIRPKALCFDYALLKEDFGIDFETEAMNEGEDDMNDLL